MNVEKIAELSRQLLIELGEDPNREGLVKTPERMAKSLIYLTRGYRQNIDDVVNGAIFASNNDNMVIVKDIELYSLCEHHMLPFYGKCHVGYIADGKVIGVSKIARIVDMFARRMQIQENLTEQIAQAIMDATGAEGVGVVIEAKHLCMMMRGVEKQHSQMTTSSLIGSFRKEPEARMEFLTLIGNR